MDDNAYSDVPFMVQHGEAVDAQSFYHLCCLGRSLFVTWRHIGRISTR